MAKQDWVYINITRTTREKLHALAARDPYTTSAGIVGRLVDEEIKRQAESEEAGHILEDAK